MRVLGVFAICAYLVATALPAAAEEQFVTAADASALSSRAVAFTTPPDGNEAAAYTTGAATLRRPARPTDPYHPSLPMGETRSAWTAPAVSPTVFALTAGEGMTPIDGRVALNITRISDERFMVDGIGRRWDSDGEVRAISLEVVSPRFVVNAGPLCIPMHVSASLHAYTLEHGIFERLRNLVEEELLGATQEIIDNHDIGGRELSIAGDDLLGSTPTWKLRFGVKVPLPSIEIMQSRLFTAISVGITLPAFGSDKSAANEDIQPDVALAYTLPISKRLWFTGAFALSWPGSTKTFDDLGVATEDVLFGWNGNLEYWFNDCWAVAGGFQFQSNYLDGTLLAMDESSTYFNIGIMWRPKPRHTIHLTWSENPDGAIAFGSARDFDGAQKDSDFTFLLGWRYSL